MAGIIKEWKAKLDKALHAKDSRVANFLGKIEAKTGVNRSHIVLGGCNALMVENIYTVSTKDGLYQTIAGSLRSLLSNPFLRPFT